MVLSFDDLLSETVLRRCECGSSKSFHFSYKYHLFEKKTIIYKSSFVRRVLTIHKELGSIAIARVKNTQCTGKV